MDERKFDELNNNQVWMEQNGATWNIEFFNLQN